jgi:anionic cell wall polymer biosynthesis LytR-Cps2A-Psr (LCP) family protein
MPDVSKKQKDFIDDLLKQIKDPEIKKKFEEESKNIKTSSDASNLIDKLKYEVERQKLVEKKEEVKKAEAVEVKEEDFKLNPNPQLALLESKLRSVAEDMGFTHCWTTTRKGPNGVALEIKFRKAYKKEEQEEKK